MTNEDASKLHNENLVLMSERMTTANDRESFWAYMDRLNPGPFAHKDGPLETQEIEKTTRDFIQIINHALKVWFVKAPRG